MPLRDKRENRDWRDRNEEWEVSTEIRWIGGVERAWLRRELASVMRELLTWAHDDMTVGSDQYGDQGRVA